MIVTARLIKRRTDDGLMTMADHVSLGKEYQIDLKTRCIRRGVNFLQNKKWKREMVQDDTGGWLPIELLEIVTS